jgi:TPR repeat protein
LLKQGADNGNATAQNLLGECYQKGNGTSVDYAKAVSCYRKAANSGNAEAQYNLAVCYSRGLGISKDMKQAFNYFQKAAGRGHARAQYEMGEFYRNGLPGVVSINIASARQWYEKSASQGYGPASNRLKQVESRM